jgi:hypothetical protein
MPDKADSTIAAENLYEKNPERIEEWARRDDLLGAASQVVIDLATDEEEGEANA